MSHLNYSRTLPGGFLTAELVNDLIRVKAKIARLQAYIASVSGGVGVNIETPADLVNFAIPVGKGANFMVAMNAFQTALDTIPSTLLADLDLGG